MPKATLSFNLPEEQEEFKLANKGADAHIALHEFDQFLRSNIKYPHDNTPELVTDTFEAIRQKLYEIINKNEIEI